VQSFRPDAIRLDIGSADGSRWPSASGGPGGLTNSRHFRLAARDAHATGRRTGFDHHRQAIEPLAIAELLASRRSAAALAKEDVFPLRPARPVD
jgi:hypothetical protein